MKKIFTAILTIFLILNAQALFEVKDASDNTVFSISDDGMRVINNGDTMMVMSTSEARINLDNSKDKALSRSFSVSTTTTAKGPLANVLEVTTNNTIMRSGSAGEQYTNFSPENIFIGLNSGINTIPNPPSNEGIANVFVGNDAGFANNTGWSNIFVGREAGFSNSGGDHNVFIGTETGYYAEDINASVFIGPYAGYSQNADHGNVYIGQSTGMYMGTGGSNVFLGTATAWNQGSGADNVIIGAGAATMIMENGTHTGSNNVVLGAEAGDALNGDNNVFIGFGAGYGYAGSNSLYIANSTTSTPLIKGTFPNTDLTFTSNKVSVVHPFGTTNGLYIQSSYNSNTDSWHFYQSSSDVLYLYFNTSWRGTWDTTTGVYTSVSDAKFKKNIEDLSKVIDKVMLLQPKKYNFTSQKDSEKKYIGMIAQDVEKLFPEFIYFNDEEQAYSMDYAGLSVVAIQAIKEQQEQINELKAEIAEIKELLNK